MHMKNIKYTFIALAIPLLVSGSSALAADTQLRVCGDIGAFSRRVVSGISERSLALQNIRTERLNAISEQWTRQDAEKVIAREQAGRIETVDFAPLERLLAEGTDDQKLALAEFKTALKTASRERQSAIDAANDKFRSSVRTALQARSRDFNLAASEFASSVQSSLDTYPAWCAMGASPLSVQANVRTRLQSVRQRFESDPRANAYVAGDIRGFTAQYKDDIRAATSAFKEKVAAAQAAFKAALGS